MMHLPHAFAAGHKARVCMSAPSGTVQQTRAAYNTQDGGSSGEATGRLVTCICTVPSPRICPPLVPAVCSVCVLTVPPPETARPGLVHMAIGGVLGSCGLVLILLLGPTGCPARLLPVLGLAKWGKLRLLSFKGPCISFHATDHSYALALAQDGVLLGSLTLAAHFCGNATLARPRLRETWTYAFRGVLQALVDMAATLHNVTVTLPLKAGVAVGDDRLTDVRIPYNMLNDALPCQRWFRIGHHVAHALSAFYRYSHWPCACSESPGPSTSHGRHAGHSALDRHCPDPPARSPKRGHTTPSSPRRAGGGGGWRTRGCGPHTGPGPPGQEARTGAPHAMRHGVRP